MQDYKLLTVMSTRFPLPRLAIAFVIKGMLVNCCSSCSSCSQPSGTSGTSAAFAVAEEAVLAPIAAVVLWLGLDADG